MNLNNWLVCCIVSWTFQTRSQHFFALWTISNRVCIITKCTANGTLVATQTRATNPISIILQCMCRINIFQFTIIFAKYTELKVRKKKKIQNMHKFDCNNWPMRIFRIRWEKQMTKRYNLLWLSISMGNVCEADGKHQH